MRNSVGGLVLRTNFGNETQNLGNCGVFNYPYYPRIILGKIMNNLNALADLPFLVFS